MLNYFPLSRAFSQEPCLPKVYCRLLLIVPLLHLCLVSCRRCCKRYFCIATTIYFTHSIPVFFQHIAAPQGGLGRHRRRRKHTCRSMRPASLVLIGHCVSLRLLHHLAIKSRRQDSSSCCPSNVKSKRSSSLSWRLAARARPLLSSQCSIWWCDHHTGPHGLQHGLYLANSTTVVASPQALEQATIVTNTWLWISTTLSHAPPLRT